MMNSSGQLISAHYGTPKFSLPNLPMHSTPYPHIPKCPLPDPLEMMETKVLFGTVPVKTFTAVLLVFYIGLLCVLEYSTFTVFDLKDIQNLLVSCFIFYFFGLIVCASISLIRHQASLLVPLMTFQVLAMLLLGFIFWKVDIREFLNAGDDLDLKCRFVLIVLLETTVACINSYTFYTTYLCYLYFKCRKALMEPTIDHCNNSTINMNTTDNSDEDDVIIFKRKQQNTDKKVRFLEKKSE